MASISSFFKGMLATPASDEPNPVEAVRLTALELAMDMVELAKDESKPPRTRSKQVLILRKAVEEVSGKHDMVLKSMVRKMKDSLKEINDDPDNAWKYAFEQILDDVFEDKFHWGRLVTVYAFERYIVKAAVEENTQSSERVVLELPRFLAGYISTNLSHKIMELGGWDNFVEYFPKYDGSSSTLWWGSLFAAGAVGAYTLSKW